MYLYFKHCLSLSSVTTKAVFTLGTRALVFGHWHKIVLHYQERSQDFSKGGGSHCVKVRILGKNGVFTLGKVNKVRVRNKALERQDNGLSTAISIPA